MQLNKFRIFNTIAFVVFCIAIGQVLSLSLTSFVYDVSTFQVLQDLKNPKSADRNLLILLSLSYSLISFLFAPGIYLLFRNRDSLKFIWPKTKVRFVTLLLSIVTVFTIIPFISVLIKFNLSIELPIWLSDLERYFKESERNAQQLTNSLLNFGDPKDLALIILTMAVIPGIVEELFFRGMVQVQLQDTFKSTQAILISAFLFSFFHFQFYGFIPRLILGILLGYIFLWSKNIWYACAAHVTNNLIGVLGSYFMGQQFLKGEGGLTSIILAVPSVAITVMTILFLKKIESSKRIEEGNQTI